MIHVALVSAPRLRYISNRYYMGTNASAAADIRTAMDALRCIVQGLRVSARAAEQRHGISGAQLFVLHQLAAGEALSVGALAERTFTHQSSVSVLVSRLATRGLVSRRTSADDARRTEVTLTPRGRALLGRAPEAAQTRLIAALQRLQPRERRAVALGLSALVKHMGLRAGTPSLFFEDGAGLAGQSRKGGSLVPGFGSLGWETCPTRNQGPETRDRGFRIGGQSRRRRHHTTRPACSAERSLVNMVEKGDFTANPRLPFISAIALAVGALCALVAVVLMWLIGFFTNVFFYHQLAVTFRSPAENQLGWGVILVPVVGGLIIGVMARYGSERIRGHGIPEAMEAILIGQSRMQPKVAVLKPLSSAISIGSGGPFGAEGPIIMTGGAVGSLIAQAFHLSASERKTLLVAGAAAGMSATFAAPVAAAMLAVELLLFEWKPRSVIPVALASAVAAALRPYLVGAGPLFPVPMHAALGGVGLLSAVAVGLAAGLLSAALTAAVYGAEDVFQRLPIHWMWWPAIGGLVVGVGGLLQPHALGVGYDTIAELLHGEFVPRALCGLILVKGTIWAIALGSGTSGGVLAPLLIMGSALGALEAFVLPGGGATRYGHW